MNALQLSLMGALSILVAVHIAAERAGSRWQWLTKGAASATFVALGFASGAAPAMLAALVLAFVGDLLLVPRDARVFRVGIVVFLLAHVALGAALVARGVSWLYAGIALVPLALAAILVSRALLPRVPSALRAAVVAYVIVISSMVALAAGSGWYLAPALAFYASDLLVARDRFVKNEFWHRAAGLPLYYGAMAAFALL